MTIEAPLEVVWELHTDVNGWTTWRSDVDSAALDGAFEPDAVFHWAIGEFEIDSAIREVEHLRRTVWGGPAQGIEGIHVWSFALEGSGVHVVTEESWSGAPIDADVAGAQALLHDSIALWLRDLTREAERRAGDST